jgi:DNA-binding protein HU-beta
MKRVAEKTGLEQKTVRRAIQQFLDEVTFSLGKGDNIQLRGFGTFRSKMCKAVTAQDFKGGTVRIPPRRRITFKVGRWLKNELKKGS